MTRLRLHYELRDLESVAPWGDDPPSLHWFGLTDGWYDLQLDEARIFETSDSDGRGVDYYVARMWEDLIAVAPHALNGSSAPRCATGAR